MSSDPHPPNAAPAKNTVAAGQDAGASAISINEVSASSSRGNSKNGTVHTDDELLNSRDITPTAPSPNSVQDGSRSKRWTSWIPLPVRRSGGAVRRWAAGPPDPKEYKIKPLFPKVQEFPIWLLDRFLPKFWQRALLTVVYLAMWATAFAMVIRLGEEATDVNGFGEPGSMSCGSAYWSMGNGCGIDGMYCRPFNGSGFAFRCPANCASYRVLNPRAVGDQEINYRPLVVGGPAEGGSSDNAVYRGDSHICSSAIHAGVVSNNNGGCGVVWLNGQHSNYVASDRNGISSVGFDSNFPLSFTFLGGVNCDAKDLRWPLLGLSVAFSSVFSLFVSSAPLFFFTIFTGVFFHVGLVSDPPSQSLSIAGLVSNILGKFLPAMFVAWIMFEKMGVRRTLSGLTAQVEKTILWLGGCWLGALENYSFEVWIPITRLTGRDLDQQPGAKAALAFIVLALVVIVASQIYFFRQEGRLIQRLKIYALFVVGILVCLVMPDLHLRIHHFILALLLLPGTALQTRPSLLYQGLLVGLFINGIARWGFDSVLQTAEALQGDGQYFSDLPTVQSPAISLASGNGTGNGTSAGAAMSTITFSWDIPAIDSMMDGISILVNDVERYRGFFRDESGGDLSMDGRTFEWKRSAGSVMNEYFRFGYMVGSSNLDYTKAGIWNKQGAWVPMASGPSKVKRSLAPEGDEEGRTWMKRAP